MPSREIFLLKYIYIYIFKLFFVDGNKCVPFCHHNFGISAVCENIFVGRKGYHTYDKSII